MEERYFTPEPPLSTPPPRKNHPRAKLFRWTETRADRDARLRVARIFSAVRHAFDA
jgi:hypothetical protein